MNEPVNHDHNIVQYQGVKRRPLKTGKTAAKGRRTEEKREDNIKRKVTDGGECRERVERVGR